MQGQDLGSELAQEIADKIRKAGYIPPSSLSPSLSLSADLTVNIHLPT